MRGGAFAALLKRYGQTVTLLPGGGAEARTARAFVRPIRDQREERVPGPLGVGRQDRFLCLGEPDVPLDGLEGGCVVWNGRALRVVNARSIYAGRRLSHWRAVLAARDPAEE